MSSSWWFQLFTKVDALAAMTGVPPAGPVFGGVQLAVLIGFIVAGLAGREALSLSSGLVFPLRQRDRSHAEIWLALILESF